MKSPTEKRKADREHMAAEIERIAKSFGAQVYVGRDKRCIFVDVQTSRGLRCCFDFDGNSCQPDVYVIPWNMSKNTDPKMNPAAFDFSVNACHGHKATLVRRGFDALRLHVETVLAADADGSAYVKGIE